MDAIFGLKNFRNEIVWKRAQPKSHTKVRMSRAHDVLLFYSSTEKTAFKMQYTENDPEYIEKFYKYVEKETGYRPTRQTVYNWARRGWLHVGVYKPLRTTRRWVLKCLETYKQMIGTNRGGRRSR